MQLNCNNFFNYQALEGCNLLTVKVPSIADYGKTEQVYPVTGIELTE